jgi:phospholipase/carboxylesterase
MKSEYRENKIGPLNVIEKRGNPDMPWIILFHGYGASSSDLAPLADEINVPEGTNWIFPDGPISVPIGPQMTGKAWFPIDMAEIEKAMMAGTHRDMSGTTPPGLSEARLSAEEMLHDLHVPMDKIILGGFSQGAMLATDLTLNSETTPKGLALLSSTLLNKDIWSSLAKKKSPLHFFQSHGTTDQVLGYQQAQNLYKTLTEQGMTGDFTEFNGGHEIPPIVLKNLSQYIKNQFQG